MMPWYILWGCDMHTHLCCKCILLRKEAPPYTNVAGVLCAYIAAMDSEDMVMRMAMHRTREQLPSVIMTKQRSRPPAFVPPPPFHPATNHNTASTNNTRQNTCSVSTTTKCTSTSSTSSKKHTSDRENERLRETATERERALP